MSVHFEKTIKRLSSQDTLTQCIEGQEGDISLSVIQTTALSLNVSSPSLCTKEPEPIVSPHQSDSEMVELANRLSTPLKAFVKQGIMSAWDVADILMDSDAIIHKDLSDNEFNKNILLIGISLITRIQFIHQSNSQSSLQDMVDVDYSKGFQRIPQEDSVSDFDKAIKDLKDYFRLLHQSMDQNMKLAKEFVNLLKGGWWGKNKSMDELIKDLKRKCR